MCLRLFDWVLELFRQCGILELFRQCGILELFRQCGIFISSILHFIENAKNIYMEKMIDEK